MAEDPFIHSPGNGAAFAAIKPNTYIMSGSAIEQEYIAGLATHNPGEIKFEPHNAFRHSKTHVFMKV